MKTAHLSTLTAPLTVSRGEQSPDVWFFDFETPEFFYEPAILTTIRLIPIPAFSTVADLTAFLDNYELELAVNGQNLLERVRLYSFPLHPPISGISRSGRGLEPARPAGDLALGEEPLFPLYGYHLQKGDQIKGKIGLCKTKEPPARPFIATDNFIFQVGLFGLKPIPDPEEAPRP